MTGGLRLVLPTISAQCTINSGEAAGQMINDYETEFVASTLIMNAGRPPPRSSTPTRASRLHGDRHPLHAVPYHGARGPLVRHRRRRSPTVTAISPSRAGRRRHAVTITGTNLSGATAVDFGTNAGTITADSAGSITATSPAGTGTVDVTVTNPDATSATSSADEFTYRPRTDGHRRVSLGRTDRGWHERDHHRDQPLGRQRGRLRIQRGDDHRRLRRPRSPRPPRQEPARST